MQTDEGIRWYLARRHAIRPRPWGVCSLSQHEYRCRVIGAGKVSGDLAGGEKASQRNDVSAMTGTTSIGLRGGEGFGAGLTGPWMPSLPFGNPKDP